MNCENNLLNLFMFSVIDAQNVVVQMSLMKHSLYSHLIFTIV